MTDSNEHLSEGSVAAFVDRRLARDERRRVEAHLADCADCREEVVAVTDLTRPRTRFRIPVKPLAAAAAVVALVTFGVLNRAETPEQPILRGDSTQPAVLAEMRGRDAFTWQPVARALEYRLSIMNASGDVVAERVTSDTTTPVPQLPAAAAYKWYITAMLDNGSVVSSRVQSFQLP